MRLLFVGDVHLSDRPPSTRTEDYADDILRKLLEVGQIAERESVDAIVYAGDMFHSKIPSRTSHSLVRKATRVLAHQNRRAPVLVVPGNHDYAGANVDELARAPLGVVAETGAVRLLGTSDYRARHLGDGTWLVGIREEESLSRFGQYASEVDVPVVLVAHSAIFPDDQDPPYDHFKAGQVAEQLEGSKCGLVLYGHIHDPHGAYRSGGVVFVNPGSLSRGSLYEADPQRIPQVAVVDVAPFPGARAEFEVRFIPLESARPWTEVFRVAEEEARRSSEATAQEFAQALSQATLEAFSIEKVIEDLRGRRGDRPVIDRAIELVESTGV